jgi:hypothetical protein
MQYNYIINKCKNFYLEQEKTLSQSSQIIEHSIGNIRDKLEILQEVKKKSIKVNSFKDKPIKSNKNLIYYCVFGDYCDLFFISLKSLLRTLSRANSNSFDFLVITDLDTKKRIEAIGFFLNFMVVEKPKNGVEASKLKTAIFNYDNIDNYENILYLDCDIIATKSIDFLFNRNLLKSNTLYTVQETCFKDIIDSPYHGFGIFEKELFFKMEINNQVPFNAGQFLFKNSLLMKLHFDNLIWFMNEWRFQSFFEQSFMNYYFNTNLLTDSTYLSDHVLLYKWNNFIKPDAKLIHFLGQALNYKDKLNSIYKFYNLKLL